MNAEIKLWTGISVILVVLGASVFVRLNQEKRETEDRKARLFLEDAAREQKAEKAEIEDRINQRLAEAEAKFKQTNP